MRVYMRGTTIEAGAGALLLLATVAQAHKGTHEHLEALHKRHREARHAQNANETVEEESFELVKRGQCAFPYADGMVAVTPGSANAGWAMSPDQPCTPGNYCPYACQPGQVSMQWDPKATSYTYPASMNGGLYCDSNGQISKPFPDKPYCQSTATNIGVINNLGDTASFCQTVLPGNEAMLIATEVQDSAKIAVPGTDYWAGTAAHYYIARENAGTACVWGQKDNPWGNWSPYVAGANAMADGTTFIKLGWNPIWLEADCPFKNTVPDWGVEIDCPNGGCNGLPCAIDPTTNGVNQMKGGQASGAGGGNFCVVTVNKGSTANFVISGSGGGKGGKGGQFYQSWSAVSSSSSATTTTTTTTASSTTSARNSTVTHSAPTSWASSNSTVQAGPTPGNYYNLFNTAGPSTAQASETAASSTAISPAIATHTGGATLLTAPLLSLLPVALWSLF